MAPRTQLSAFCLLLSSPVCLQALDTDTHRFALERDGSSLAEELRQSLGGLSGGERGTRKAASNLGSGLMRREISAAGATIAADEDGPRRPLHRAASTAPPKKPPTAHVHSATGVKASASSAMEGGHQHLSQPATAERHTAIHHSSHYASSHSPARSLPVPDHPVTSGVTTAVMPRPGEPGHATFKPYEPPDSEDLNGIKCHRNWWVNCATGCKTTGDNCGLPVDGKVCPLDTPHCVVCGADKCQTTPAPAVMTSTAVPQQMAPAVTATTILPQQVAFTNSANSTAAAATAEGDLYESKDFEMVVDCTNCGECAWGGADKTGTPSLGGSGHTPLDCQTACLTSPTCHAAALSHSGICHMFEVCNDPTPEGDKTRWLKKKKVVKEEATKQVPVMALDCMNCGECAWSGRDPTDASLGGNGHTSEECKQACMASDTCQVAARSPSGYCNLFTHCSQAAPEGDKTRWKKTMETVAAGPRAAAGPKRAPDPSISAGKTAMERLATDVGLANSTIDERQRAKFAVAELAKVEAAAGVPITVGEPDMEAQSVPGDLDADTKEELLSLYGLVAFILVLCLGGVFRYLHSSYHKDYAGPHDQVWARQNVVEKVHLEPQGISSESPAAPLTGEH